MILSFIKRKEKYNDAHLIFYMVLCELNWAAASAHIDSAEIIKVEGREEAQTDREEEEERKRGGGGGGPRA